MKAPRHQAERLINLENPNPGKHATAGSPDVTTRIPYEENLCRIPQVSNLELEKISTESGSFPKTGGKSVSAPNRRQDGRCCPATLIRNNCCMISIRRAADRGHANHGWLKTHHTFSFADYQDPKQMGFRSLRVMNEDEVAPEQGFGMHGHRDMEIVTYVLEGELEHQDSMGNGEVLRPGEFQHMSAGSGIRHSEFNPSKTVPVHLYQIWLLPEKPGLLPSYSQKAFSAEGRQDRWQVVASRDGRDGSLRINQDAAIELANLSAGSKLVKELAPGRHAWLQVLRGSVSLNGQSLPTSDGAAISGETNITLDATVPAEVMLFDLD